MFFRIESATVTVKRHHFAVDSSLTSFLHRAAPARIP